MSDKKISDEIKTKQPLEPLEPEILLPPNNSSRKRKGRGGEGMPSMQGARALTVSQVGAQTRDILAKGLLAKGNPFGGAIDQGYEVEIEAKLAPSETSLQVNQEQLSLPGIVPKTPGNTAPMSNHLARSSLFAPIKRGRRKLHDNTSLPAPDGCSIRYTGKQLDMADSDVFLVALKIARGQQANTPIKVTRAEFLKLCGWTASGNSNYKWLEDSFFRLADGRLRIETGKIKASLPLMGPLQLDKETGEWSYYIPKETLALFGTREYAYVDLEKRRQLSHRADLAKWLQSYALSHEAGEHRVSVENLKLWSGYEGRLRDYRVCLSEALKELVRVGILKVWEFYEKNKKVKWIR